MNQGSGKWAEKGKEQAETQSVRKPGDLQDPRRDRQARWTMRNLSGK